MHPIIRQFRTRRETLGVSQKELAEQAGLSRDLIAKLETGTHTNPTLRTVERLEKALADAESRAAATAGV